MRYLLIDMDKVRSGECNINNPDNWVGLNLDLAILSEEETLAKFKEIWDDGHECGFIDGFDGYTVPKTKEQDWEQFKETL